ncbi:hypothetical protein POM88_021196 [Heracleum sosnowskyi]|uniref:Uncharacterized protein n=1 Tax=Heracleum sosnowskyi TaxID=360622 RepID=A0AAD8MS89_9APIA|nr:hypothetical protein POM88_021196 [Heracleum sosnowskyi]
MTPTIRKHDFGCEKRKIKRRVQELVKSQAGVLDKFFVKESQVSCENQNLDDHVDVNVDDVNVNHTTTHNVKLILMPLFVILKLMNKSEFVLSIKLLKHVHYAIPSNHRSRKAKPPEIPMFAVVD